jgi:hypothetical protein
MKSYDSTGEAFGITERAMFRESLLAGYAGEALLDASEVVDPTTAELEALGRRIDEVLSAPTTLTRSIL